MPDSLTGLPTHRDLGKNIPNEATLALWVDIDGLIWLNDQLGFEAGHRAITSVAAVLGTVLEPVATGLFRVAGDEFLALLQKQDLNAAITLADDAVRAVDSLRIPYQRADRPSANNVQINVAVLRLEPEALTQSLGQYGLGDPLHALVADTIYREKIRSGVPAGIVVTVSVA